MTKNEFIEKNKHEFFGIILDAFNSQITGGPLAEKMRRLMARCDALLGNYYDTLVKTEPPPIKPVGISGTQQQLKNTGAK